MRSGGVVEKVQLVGVAPAGLNSARANHQLRALQQFDIDDSNDIVKTTPPTPTILYPGDDGPPTSASDTEAPTPPWYVRSTSSPSFQPSFTAKPSVATLAPTDTDEFPVELRTTPPTPTFLYDEGTNAPIHGYPTFYPTMAPTCDNSTSRADQVKCAALAQMAQVQADWSTVDTIVLSVALTVVFCTCFLYCLCCRQGKDGLKIESSRMQTLKGEYVAVGQDAQDGLITPPESSSPPTTPRVSRYGGVEVINPLAETSPLLSPPRNQRRAAAREQVGQPIIPIRRPSKILGGENMAATAAVKVERGSAGGGGGIGGLQALAMAEAVESIPRMASEDDMSALL